MPPPEEARPRTLALSFATVGLTLRGHDGPAFRGHAGLSRLGPEYAPFLQPAPLPGLALRMGTAPPSGPRAGAGSRRLFRGTWDLFRERESDLYLDYGPFHAERRPVLSARLSGGTGEIDYDLAAGEVFKEPLPYPLNQILLLHALGLRRGVLLHGCGLALGRGADPRGVLCIGPSGAGKSTLASLFDASAVLNDDRVVAVEDGRGEVLLGGTPWNGDLPHRRGDAVPLGGILFLEKAPRTRILPMARSEALARLTVALLAPYWDPKRLDRHLDFLLALLHRFPCAILESVPGPAVPLEVSKWLA